MTALTLRRWRSSHGVVAWDVEVTNQVGERVAGFDILTLVAKRG
jgi:acyl dehydratase